MKQFTIIKIGYTGGEYFNCIYINEDGMNNFLFSGMYGTDGRIEKEMKEKGYEKIYLNSTYGRMKLKEISKAFIEEYEAVKKIRTTL